MDDEVNTRFNKPGDHLILHLKEWYMDNEPEVFGEELCIYSEDGICKHPDFQLKSCNGNYYAVPYCKKFSVQDQSVERRINDF